MKTPVAFIIFNRPDTTERVFAEIAKAKPPCLFVIADGPRADRPDESEKCAATRAIINQVDWECEVLTNFSDVNLGCKQRVSSGLDWVFENCEEAIVLEDDCLPHPTFFSFCEELLERYRHDERVMVVSGNNFQFGHRHGHQRPYDSYYFSCYNHCWGWATWRRAWSCFDIEMKNWPLLRETEWLEDVTGSKKAASFWTTEFNRVFAQTLNSWAILWTYSCWSQSGLSILPSINLVSNIGFGENSTHTKAVSKLANLPIRMMEFPLQHPQVVVRDLEADKYTFERVFLWYGEEPTLQKQTRRQIMNRLPLWMRQAIAALRQ